MGYYGLQWVTMGYNEQSDIINKNIGTHRNSQKLITQTAPSTTTEFLVRRAHATDISCTTEFLVRRGQMQHPLAPYRISCQKGSDATLGKKNTDGLYFGVLPIRIYFC